MLHAQEPDAGVNAADCTAKDAHDRDSKARRGVPAPASLPCGCPTGPGHRITDPTVHDAWHALVVDQGGPAGPVTLQTLRDARGLRVLSLGETSFDTKARESGKRASGALREASR